MCSTLLILYRRPVIRTRHGGESTRVQIARAHEKVAKNDKEHDRQFDIDIEHSKLTNYVPTQLPPGTGTTVHSTLSIAITCTYTMCPVTAPHGCGETAKAMQP